MNKPPLLMHRKGINKYSPYDEDDQALEWRGSIPETQPHSIEKKWRSGTAKDRYGLCKIIVPRAPAIESGHRRQICYEEVERGKGERAKIPGVEQKERRTGNRSLEPA
jgi:hypothetical protein